MKTRSLLSLLLLVLSGPASLIDATATPNSPDPKAPASVSRLASNSVSENSFDLSSFGAVGDGVTDDGPALQNALDAIATAGGGTLFVPAGRYAIITPVQKNFAGLATSLTIQGVESSTPVPPPTAGAGALTGGLDLVSEFAPRTGALANAITLAGLETFLIKDIVFIGTPEVTTDALITLALGDISEATIRHCEFYGLSSLAAGGAIVLSVRSHLKVEQSVFLGSTTNSGVQTSVVQNIEWKGITIADAVFADYGQRVELFGKLGLAAPFSWVSIGNAAIPENDSPRREAVIRNVFLDEGALNGLSSLPYLYLPASASIDLIYVSGLFMNVSNLGTSGNYFDGTKRVLVANSHYGWSHNADSAINLLSVGNAILDQVECVDSADRIRADAATGKLSVINSVYTHLDSEAQTTDVITTAPEDDPVQHVRQQFIATLGREPDAAAHFYWSDQILHCGADAACTDEKRAALATYLGSAPAPTFAITGRITNESDAGLPGVSVTLSGAQLVTTTTDSAGQYYFSNLPTSGVYTVTPTLEHHTLDPLSRTIVTPAGDQSFDAAATFNHHAISGRVADAAGAAVPSVTVTLSGALDRTMSTDADGNYSFANLPAGGAYTVTPQKTSYTFAPAGQTFTNLGADQDLNFTGSFVTYSIDGIIVGANNNPMAGVTVTLAGSENVTTTSDNTGTFSFAGLPSEGSYTVTPNLIGYSFSPSSRNFADLAANHYDNYLATYTTHSISGRVTDASNGAALSGAVVTLSGYTSGTTITDANGNYSFVDLARSANYTLTVARPHCTFTPPSQTFTNLTASETADFNATVYRVIEFSAASYAVTESTGMIALTVNRAGDTTAEATVIYSAADGTAHQGDDLSSVIGQITYAPGETSQTFTVFITNDAFVEGIEQLTISLSDPQGAALGSLASATLTISDNDNDSGTPNPNPVDDAEFFVRQHYRDFLNREPDAAGLAFWSNQILSCEANAACVTDRRINVSAAFFLSIEFQETGFLVHRLYTASFAQPPQHRDEFLLDTRTIAQGVVVNAPGWQQLLEDNKTAFVNEFVGRAAFSDQYPLSLTPTEFVDSLNATAAYPLAADALAAAVGEFNGSTDSSEVAARARVLRRVAESATFSQQQLNPAFVLMQYFGYLQRNPSDAPDSNLDGYNFWLAKLNEFDGDFRRAQMVQSFLVSGEYRNRFGL